ncbi:cellulase family glycosylhydrolase [Paraburkholderia sp. J11-2]|uniref:cellulase family glycosylhydrolase n=1 Tax=Paraburkholderia sp. J11-2 TaxID=2805431 RepID=UPI002AB798D3|nr:cellulase family glycosylhydrolase [Paraburkholderia sp. J11-2]
MAKQESELNLVSKTNLTSVRFDMPWKYIETRQGEYSIPADLERYVDMAIKRGIQPVLILDYGNSLYDGGDKPRSAAAINAYARYATFVVAHFRGRVNQFEVWNEWDNYTGGFRPGSPEDYATLFRAVYPVLKATNPDATIVVGAGVRKGWEERLAELGIVQMGDGLAVHPYNYQVTDDLAPEHCIRALIELEERLRHLTRKAKVDLYVTEIGWPTNIGKFGVSEETQRSFATRLVLLARSLPYIKGIWWYDLVDDGNDPTNKEHHFGLFRIDLTSKSVASGMSSAATFVATHALTLANTNGFDEGVVAIEARPLMGGPRTAVVWDVRQTGRMRVDCGKGDDVMTIDQTFGAASVSPIPAIVTAHRGQCSSRLVDPT